MSVCFFSQLRRGALIVVAVLLAAELLPRTAAQDSCAATPQPKAAETWRFAVSGDSRNCGDVIMPAIAAGVKKDEAQFYWHLGDFRWIKDVDQDYKQGAVGKRAFVSLDDYEHDAWKDFRDNQLKAFQPVQVFLGIGNHELIPPKSRNEYVKEFDDWINSAELKCQRRKDDRNDTAVKTYYHWLRGGVDFINLDNAGPEGFPSDELQWLKDVLGKDRDDKSTNTVVVGMHEALPESISRNHSMNQTPDGEQSGRSAYRELLKFQNTGHKKVYVLASHSHFFMDGIFNTEYWRNNGGVLPGWIVGTAGAVRYPLPPNSGDARAAKTNVYGYLIGTVNPEGEPPGTIRFEFHELSEDAVPGEVVHKFSSAFVDQCFTDNSEARR